MDLKGAYTLLNVHPDDVPMFTQQLMGDLIYIHLCGVFGWTETPFPFEVVTRAVRGELKHRVRGYSKMYVDDIFGFSLRRFLKSDLQEAKKVCVDLLGPDAVAEHKTESGTRVEMVGWTLDMDEELLTVAYKNLLKAMYGFFTVDLEQPATLDLVQRLMSWSSRYVLVCGVMAPFQASLNALSAGRSVRHSTSPWSGAAKTAVRMWRAMLALVAVNEKQHARSLQSFKKRTPTHVVVTDASLSQVGFLIFALTDSGETCLGGGAVSIAEYEFGGDSSNQNTAEFIGSMLGITALVKLGVKDTGILLRVDSMTALKWSITWRLKGERGVNAAMAMSALCMNYGIDIVGTDFLAGVDNWQCDNLSRADQKGMSVKEMMEKNGLPGVRNVVIDDDPAVKKLLGACNPTMSIGSETEFSRVWSALQSSVKELRRE